MWPFVVVYKRKWGTSWNYIYVSGKYSSSWKKSFSISFIKCLLHAQCYWSNTYSLTNNETINHYWKKMHMYNVDIFSFYLFNVPMKSKKKILAFLNIMKYSPEWRDIGLCRSIIKCNITWDVNLATSFASCSDFKKKLALIMCTFKQNRFSTLECFFLFT